MFKLSVLAMIIGACMIACRCKHVGTNSGGGPEWLHKLMELAKKAQKRKGA